MPKQSYPPILAEIRCLVQDLLKDEQINPALSEEIAHNTAELIRSKWGGQQIYIPRGRTVNAQQRQQDILSAFNGNNHAELCDRFGISIQRVYQIIKHNQQLQKSL